MRSYSIVIYLAVVMAATLNATETGFDPQQILKQLQELRQNQQQLQQTIAQQQKTIEALQKQLSEAAEKQKVDAEAAVALAPPPGAPSNVPLPQPSASQPSFRIGGAGSYIDISLDVLAAAAWSSETNGTMRNLQFGGHDPHERGFTLQNAELALEGAVDPYFRGDAFIITQIDRGETTVELEEAYLTTTQLPWNLQVKAGQFVTEFGRIGQSKPHPHTWDFADQPVVWGRLFGPDGLRNPGARVSWLAPTPFYLELFGTAQNAGGGTAYSFLNKQGETFAGRTLTGRTVHNIGDLLYTLRANSSFDLDDENTLSAGASSAFGPNSTGDHASTAIYGADVYWRWKPVANDHGWPFVKWTTEALRRDYEAAEQPGFAAATLNDWGFYTELAWGIRRPWVTGFRMDYAEGNDPTDPQRDRRMRFSPNVTYYFSEFSKLRLQYNMDRAQHLNDKLAHGAFLQFEFMLGAHGAHKF
ncbi:MAG: hypothetical protein NTY01_08735 [Verrucomicrobia bacterium]|nr:hypothetical protein [Verrucomicrobiota bacterium]